MSYKNRVSKKWTFTRQKGSMGKCSSCNLGIVGCDLSYGLDLYCKLRGIAWPPMHFPFSIHPKFVPIARPQKYAMSNLISVLVENFM